MRAATIAATGLWAAYAAQSFARPLEPAACPAMPPSADIEASRAGGLQLGLGGFSIGGNRARSTTSSDIFVRSGGWEAWSRAAALAYACAQAHRLYPNDPLRQLEAFWATLNRLNGRATPMPAPSRTYASPSLNNSNRPVFDFNALWQPLDKRQFQGWYGIEQGRAQVSCTLSNGRGLTDCRVITEWPPGQRIGEAAVAYLTSLRMTSDARRYDWGNQQVNPIVNFVR